MSKPRSKSATFALRIRRALFDRLDTYADTHGVPRSGTLIWALDAFLTAAETGADIGPYTLPGGEATPVKATVDNSRVMVAVKLKPVLARRLDLYAQVHGLSKTSVAVWALDRFLTRAETCPSAGIGAPQDTQPIKSEDRLSDKARRDKDRAIKKLQQERPVEPDQVKIAKEKATSHYTHQTIEEMLGAYLGAGDAEQDGRQVVLDTLKGLVHNSPGLFYHVAKTLLAKWQQTDPAFVVDGCIIYHQMKDSVKPEFHSQLRLLRQCTGLEDAD